MTTAVDLRTYYLIQWIPDLARHERINVAVVIPVYGGALLRHNYLQGLADSNTRADVEMRLSRPPRCVNVVEGQCLIDEKNPVQVRLKQLYKELAAR